MKKIILASILFIFPLICSADFSIDKWQYYKEIQAVNTGLTILSLDDDIFSNAKGDLADLRIMNNNNQEVPYKMIVATDRQKVEIFYPKMLNNSFVSGQNSTVILDFEGGVKLVNKLKIITSSENFQRSVIIYGSDNMSDWSVLNDKAYIYDYTDRMGDIKTQDTTVDFPQSVYRYIKLEISDPENNPVKIAKVEAINFVKEKSKEVARNSGFQITEDEKEKATEVVVDLGAKGIPTNKVLLSISDKNFNRAILIYTSNDNNDWRFNGNGYIFRYNTPKFVGENLLLNFNETSDQYIKIIVQNKDNQPLNISSATTYSTYREIIFQTESGVDYKLYYGNNKAMFPEYDLDKYFQYLEVENATSATLSGRQINPKYVPEQEPEKPLSERIPFLLPGALIAACLILGFLVFKFFQKK
ncbi:DUF3999 domain-containing protein [Patescibacteria group bacterium]|nr:DUF3999 domain-containing protein [Patescibacteria group bacterium]MBU4601202.1 DUF3999 domain-containing protein [Patescibacteria group bacterium]MCG2698233.1 DUF3999 domain-containing protein [Candidatus Parcubacteria bacterium]